MKHSVFFDFETALTADERAKLIKEAGFTHTFLWRYKNDVSEFMTQVNAAHKAGLIVETVHAEYHGINKIWTDSRDGEEMFEFLLKTVEECHEIEVPVMICHVSSGYFPPMYNKLGFQRFQAICDKGEECGVKIAFENLKKRKYLYYVLDNISSPAAYFCFDCGHENLYDLGEGILEKYSDRLVALHLHDNFGKNDDHLIPFDGSIDWNNLCTRLSKVPECPITAEIVKDDNYKEYTNSQYLKRVYDAVVSIDNAISEAKK